jgi:hypothetical protein
MKSFLWLVIAWFIVCSVSFGAETTKHIYKVRPAAKGKVTVRQINEIDVATLKQEGYEDLGGSLIESKDWADVGVSQYCLLNKENYPEKPVKIESCVIVVRTRGGEFGDAILINFNGNDLRILDSSDTNCTSSIFPDSEIIAVGRFVNRQPPDVGGYAETIKYAWITDHEKVKLKKIPASSVSCEVNEDRD